MRAVRVAFVGKGGSGKSVLAGTFARLLGRRGAPVLVLDSDPMPGLAISLGVVAGDAGIPPDAVEPGPGGSGVRLRDGLTAQAVIERYAAHAPDRVRLLQIRKVTRQDPEVTRSHQGYAQVLDALVASPDSGPGSALRRWQLVGDLPGGTRQPFLGWGRYADTFLVVVEPTAKSMLAARRLSHLATGWSHGRSFDVVAVASKVREPGDAERVAEHTGLEVVAEVPWDPRLETAERTGRAVVDHDPDAPAVRAVASLVERFAGHDEQEDVR